MTKPNTSTAKADDWVAWLDNTPIKIEFHAAIISLQGFISALATERDAAIARAEQAKAERDELDFILNEGSEDSFAKVIARAEQAKARVKDLEGALRDMIEGYEEYNLSNGKPVLQPIEKQSSWIQRARAVLLQEEPKP